MGATAGEGKAGPRCARPAQTALSRDDPREIGGHRLHGLLGAGGMGVVYLAYTLGGRPIALKAVREEFAAAPGFRERFAQEVAGARRIHGLVTAQVVDSGVDALTPWLATAYVPASALQQVVRRHGPLPVRTALLLVGGIAEALQGIPGAGVVRRDLKPADVLTASDGPRAIDFGIARAADAAALTGAGLRIGTAASTAPEQALGRQVTAATDVFALGALAAYMACGAAPFGDGRSPRRSTVWSTSSPTSLGSRSSCGTCSRAAWPAPRGPPDDRRTDGRRPRPPHGRRPARVRRRLAAPPGRRRHREP
ncbi:serine/threonine-protein kinase [Streptomyces sp. NPDC002463]|uniref:serine/threonine-protein kinase n=1 Tax=Streptomyces sp. NPDC002463 TaxID=3364645 RepID=UPI0036942F80